MITADVGFFTSDNEVVVSIEGFTQRLIEFPPALAGYLFGRDASPFSEPVIGSPGQIKRQIDSNDWLILLQGQGIWARVIARLVLDAHERDIWQSLGIETVSQAMPDHHALPGVSDRQYQWLLQQLVAKEAAAAWILAQYQLVLELAQISFAPAAHDTGADQGALDIQCDGIAFPGSSLLLHQEAQFIMAVVEHSAPGTG